MSLEKSNKIRAEEDPRPDDNFLAESKRGVEHGCGTRCGWGESATTYSAWVQKLHAKAIYLGGL